jgi:hypothetical protein
MKNKAKFLRIDIPLRYDDEDMPFDFPLRTKSENSQDYDSWVAVIDLQTGEIQDFPKDVSLDFFTKVCDEGLYFLLDGNKQLIAKAGGDYVPNRAIPPIDGYGDYIHLKIEYGVVVNLYTNPDFSQFEEVSNDA